MVAQQQLVSMLLVDEIIDKCLKDVQIRLE